MYFAAVVPQQLHVFPTGGGGVDPDGRLGHGDVCAGCGGGRAQAEGQVPGLTISTFDCKGSGRCCQLFT